MRLARSYGDDIMTTGFVRDLKTRFPKKKILIGDGEREYLSPIFLHNPNITHGVFLKKNDDAIWLKDYPHHRLYINYARSTKYRQVFRKFKPLRGKLYLTASEIASAKRALKERRSFVVIEPNVQGACGRTNKDWGFEKWQKVVDQLRLKTDFVQLGRKDVLSLNGVTRIVTKDFRAAAAVLSLAKLFVGTEGGLHHAAAALNVKGVVIFGGRTSPQTTGYLGHTNLYVKGPKSPCGRISSCDHCKKCLEKISVKNVVEAIVRRL
jgi:ADP-heptose:LPS heptosyltransferase